MIVAVSGAGGRMGSLVAQTVATHRSRARSALRPSRCRFDGGWCHDR